MMTKLRTGEFDSVESRSDRSDFIKTWRLQGLLYFHCYWIHLIDQRNDKLNRAKRPCKEKKKAE